MFGDRSLVGLGLVALRLWRNIIIGDSNNFNSILFTPLL
jgi:hypothetical protein